MSNASATKNGIIKGRWEKLNSIRSAVLTRARDAAELTIPSLMPPEGHTENDQLGTPNQGMGSRGVNNLASKLLLTLLPPNTPCVKLAVDDFTLIELTQDKSKLAEIEEAFSRVERAVMTDIETTAMRTPAFLAFKYLIVTGNCLLYSHKDGTLKVYRLDQYVVKRDPMGVPNDILIKEIVSPMALPVSVRARVLDELKQENTSDVTPVHDITVELFTRVSRQENDSWRSEQEVLGISIDETAGTYPKDACPYLPLRWNSISGEDYGRGLTEEVLGDLRSLEALSMAINEGSAAAAKLVFLVDPNGTTKVRDLAKCRNGDFVAGRESDVTVLQMNKQADLKVAAEWAARIEQRLSHVFLLNSSVQRSAERVTAQEIRYMAAELEDALGGVYSVLSLEMQLPLIRLIMKRLEKSKKLPKLPSSVKPLVTTGLEALGRGHEAAKLETFLRVSTEALGPDTVAKWINSGDALKRLGVGYGINMDGLVRTQEEVAQADQQAQMQALLAKLGGGPATELTKGLVNGSTQAPNPGAPQ